MESDIVSAILMQPLRVGPRSDLTTECCEKRQCSLALISNYCCDTKQSSDAEMNFA
jgi:hypothetical protein